MIRRQYAEVPHHQRVAQLVDQNRYENGHYPNKNQRQRRGARHAENKGDQPEHGVNPHGKTEQREVDIALCGLRFAE